jgi:hypothetical protein
MIPGDDPIGVELRLKSPTRRVLAFAPQFPLLPFLVGMHAAVLAVFPTLRHQLHDG